MPRTSPGVQSFQLSSAARRALNFDVYQCTNCKGYVHVLWSAGEFASGFHGRHAFKILPWPIGKPLTFGKLA
jgi:hypothetical protein